MMRELFKRLEDENIVDIEVDLNALAYSNAYSWLFSVFIKFDASGKNAMDFEEYLETKESLIISLESQDRAKYVGSRIVDGWNELYFYAKDSKTLDGIVSKILTTSNYIYESNVVKDTRWDFHYKNLCPSELELAHIQSEKVIFLLEEEGDDLEKQRVVEHYVSFELPTQKNRFLNTLNIDGFSFKDDISTQEFEYGVALEKTHNVTRDEVKNIVEELFKEVKKFQGYYEGWSTALVEDKNV